MALTADDLAQLDRWADNPDAGFVAFLTARPAWHVDAACRGAGPAPFYPVARSRAVYHQKQRAAAEAEVVASFCAECPVAEECLSDALAHDDLEGVWGGLSGRERRRLGTGAA